MAGLFSIINIWDVILPIDFHSIIFQDGEIAPPTSIITNGIINGQWNIHGISSIFLNGILILMV